MKISEDSMGFKHHDMGVKGWHRLEVSVSNGKATYHCNCCGEVYIEDFP